MVAQVQKVFEMREIRLARRFLFDSVSRTKLLLDLLLD
jgi:hypothetical protein